MTRSGYVIDGLAIGDSGYGDYIILDVLADGTSDGWNVEDLNLCGAHEGLGDWASDYVVVREAVDA